MITQDYLRSILSYDSETGLFTWLVSKSNRAPVGSSAGSKDYHGYVRIRIDGRTYSAQNLAWLYITGEYPYHIVDHENQVRDDNRWSNLRKATVSENNHNSCKPSHNTSGIKGISLSKGKWRGRVKLLGIEYCTGSFSHKDEAIEALRLLRAKLHKDFANNG